MATSTCSACRAMEDLPGDATFALYSIFRAFVA
jgi:hypothetical protein